MRGFTLIELAAVLLISGLLLAGSIAIYNSYLKQKAREDTYQAAETITEAMAKFYTTYGFYPCPASRNAKPGDPKYGRSMDCTDTSVPAGSCSAAYCVSERDHDNNSATPPLRIRTGAIPFHDLAVGIESPEYYEDPFQIGGGDTLDGFRRDFVYAVTEKQATDNYIDGLGGAIQVKDEYGRPLHDKVDYIIVSKGDNGDIPCPSGGGGAVTTPIPPDDPVILASASKDRENCDFDGDFVDALYSTAGGTNYFDDIVVYRRWVPYFLWTVAKSNEENIHNINSGNVGIGLDNPQEKLHIKDGSFLTEQNVISERICADDGSDCFSANLLGGDAGSGGGMKCTAPGRVMKGVRNGAPIPPGCSTLASGPLNGTCNSGYICGFSYTISTSTARVLCRSPGSSTCN